MQSPDPEAPIIELGDETEQPSTIEFHMTKLENLGHGDVLDKMRLVKKVTAMIKARKLGKVHPEKKEEPVVEQVKAMHTEDDEHDEACAFIVTGCV